MTRLLPVASGADTRRYAGGLLRRHRRALGVVLGLHVLAVVSGLFVPRLIGGVVEDVRNARITVGTVDRVAITVAVLLTVQAVLFRFAGLRSARLGERVLGEVREEIVDRILPLPLPVVESTSYGDLLTRATRDVDALSTSIRYAVPDIATTFLTVLLTVSALVLVDPLLALPSLVSVPILVVSTRWYLRRAPAGYLRQTEAYAHLNDGMALTAHGVRTVEALRLQDRRVRRTDDDIRTAYARERYTLRLRSVWLPSIEVSYVLPIACTLVIGGVLYGQGRVSLAQVTAAALYLQQLGEPVNRMISWLDRLQLGNASLARLLGLAQVPPNRTGSDAVPADGRLTARDLRYAYAPGDDVLHGVDLDCRPGERLAVVGPSGAGKTTLGRLLAGLYVPTGGTVRLGGVSLADLPPPELRRHVALVTQEQHVFLATVRENVALVRPAATDAEVRDALAAVGALDWVLALPNGLDTVLGAAEHALSPGQAQQLALARVVLADPGIVVLDEATASIDPGSARELERGLGAVLADRAVIAIAHRLHTAHDADRVAVLEDGRLLELGPHDELLGKGGAYARLWASWHGRRPPGPGPGRPRSC